MRRHLLAILALLLLIGGSAPAEAGDISVIYNDPVGKAGPRDACTERHCQALLKLIRGATTSLDFAIYGLRDQTALLDALVAAQARGVRVRGIVDADIDGQNYYTSTPELVRRLGPGVVKNDHASERRAALLNERVSFKAQPHCERPPGHPGPLQCLGFTYKDKCIMAEQASRDEDFAAGQIMHNKYVIADRRWVWTGSTNLSDSGTGGYNANVVVVIDSPRTAAHFTRDFEQMWVDDSFHEDRPELPIHAEVYRGGARGRVLFSPKNLPITKVVRPLLRGAKKRIDVAIFFLTHKGITMDLIDAAARGVDVRVILDATGATNEYSKHEILRAAGVKLKVESWGGKMHAKAALIDAEHLVLGSMNWTSAGEGGNDENTIILSSTSHARGFMRWFDHMWQHVETKWLTAQPQPESLDSGTACSDGVDNDFDGLADSADPSCADPVPPNPPRLPFRIIERRGGHRLVKGDVSASGGKVFYLPGREGYDDVLISTTEGDRFFCSKLEAEEAGFIQAGMHRFKKGARRYER